MASLQKESTANISGWKLILFCSHNTIKSLAAVAAATINVTAALLCSDKVAATISVTAALLCYDKVAASLEAFLSLACNTFGIFCFKHFGTFSFIMFSLQEHSYNYYIQNYLNFNAILGNFQRSFLSCSSKSFYVH